MVIVAKPIRARSLQVVPAGGKVPNAGHLAPDDGTIADHRPEHAPPAPPQHLDEAV